MEQMSRLECRKLSFSYTKKPFLEVDMVLTPGVYGLLGPNGAGKSTLISLIVGNRFPKSGKILWNDREVKKDDPDYRKILGYKPQMQSVYPELKVYEFLAYIAGIKGISQKERPEQIETLLLRLHLAEQKAKRMKNLSGGMLQRVMLAQALLGDPKLVILDEPSAGLDPMERINMRKFIGEISKEKIVLVATHIIEDLIDITKEVIFMKNGQIVLKGDMVRMREIYEKIKTDSILQAEKNNDEVLILEKLYEDFME